MEQGLEGALINVEISVAFSPDGTRAVSTSVDWISHVPGSHSSIVWAVAFSHDGTRVVSGSGDNSAKIWNASTGEVEVVIEGHSDGLPLHFHVMGHAWSLDRMINRSESGMQRRVT